MHARADVQHGAWAMSPSSAHARAQAHLGTWHDTEVAVKGLYPSVLLGGAGSDGLTSRAAIAGLLREADLLAGLSHPNIIWLYGVVLPELVRGGALLWQSCARFPGSQAGITDQDASLELDFTRCRPGEQCRPAILQEAEQA
jgi:hypothetical protein